MSLKIGENVVWVSNSLDLNETPSKCVSHPDQSFFAYGTLVVVDWLRMYPFSAGTAFMLMQTGWIQASRRVTRRLA